MNCNQRMASTHLCVRMQACLCLQIADNYQFPAPLILSIQSCQTSHLPLENSTMANVLAFSMKELQFRRAARKHWDALSPVTWLSA